MQLFRIARKKYTDDLSGEGAKKYGGRWNHKGVNVIYTSEHKSLAVLEVLAHTPISTIPDDLEMLELSIPDDVSVKEIPVNSLPKNWRSYPAPNKLGEIGTNWASSKKSLLLKVPSVIIPSESNILINPRHPDFFKVSIKETQAFSFDNRLQK